MLYTIQTFLEHKEDLSMNQKKKEIVPIQFYLFSKTHVRVRNPY